MGAPFNYFLWGGGVALAIIVIVIISFLIKPGKTVSVEYSETGPPGATGLTGATGATGAAGTIGSTGIGLTGATGSTLNPVSVNGMMGNAILSTPIISNVYTTSTLPKIN